MTVFWLIAVAGASGALGYWLGWRDALREMRAYLKDWDDE